MQDKCTFDYAIVRVVPRVDREEFINVGAIFSCPAKKILQARIELDERRLLAFAPDLDMKLVKQHLDTIPAICAGGDEAGPIGLLPQRARFYWLTAPRSTIIQTSTVHTGLSATPEAALEHLLNTMVRQFK
jgi:Protein of unknown function (DUF3037)